MLYRLSVAAIVCFWLWMAALLVRTVWLPGETSPTPVPLGYVGHLIFRHEMSSDLILYRQRRRLDGSLHLQPKRLPGGEGQPPAGNLLSATGNCLLGLPGVAGQRVIFRGAVELDPGDQARRLELSISLREPGGNTPGVVLHLDGRLTENRWHYQLAQAGAVLREGSGTPEELLASLDLRPYGFDPGLVSRYAAAAEPVTIDARRGKLRVREDELEAYVVTVRRGESFEATIHVNQVGQVLAVKTSLGFDLYDETLTP